MCMELLEEHLSNEDFITKLVQQLKRLDCIVRSGCNMGGSLAKIHFPSKDIDLMGEMALQAFV